jgi:hypothetical protein
MAAADSFVRMLAEFITRSHSDSVLPLRIFFGLCLTVVLAADVYFLRHRERFFGHKGTDHTTDSAAAGNLRMWMVILVLIHATVILALMIIEV